MIYDILALYMGSARLTHPHAWNVTCDIYVQQAQEKTYIHVYFTQITKIQCTALVSDYVIRAVCH